MKTRDDKTNRQVAMVAALALTLTLGACGGMDTSDDDDDDDGHGR